MIALSYVKLDVHALLASGQLLFVTLEHEQGTGSEHKHALCE